MPSVKQILAEIQLDPTLPPTHKQKVTQIIHDAEQRLLLKGYKSRPRNITNSTALVTLERWEVENGILSPRHMVKWIKDNNLNVAILETLILQFRQEMVSKGKQYANFKAAFQTYLNKGYLTKSLAECVNKTTTHLEMRGGSL